MVAIVVLGVLLAAPLGACAEDSSEGSPANDQPGDEPPTAITDPSTGDTATAAPAAPSGESVVRPLTPDEVARAEALLIEAADCPVGFDQLRMVEVPFWGFDDTGHTGTLIVNVDVAEEVGDVFEQLFDARFAIQRIEAIDPLPPDDTDRVSSNTTVAFKCRSVRGGSSWSQHAYGHAVDINPVDNPNVSAAGDATPPLGADRTDRSLQEPGMIHEGGVVTQAFDAIGWSWGGRWTSHQDFMHFSINGQ